MHILNIMTQNATKPVMHHRRKPTADYASFLIPSPWVDSYKFPRFHA